MMRVAHDVCAAAVPHHKEDQTGSGQKVQDISELHGSYLTVIGWTLKLQPCARAESIYSREGVSRNRAH